MARLRITWIRSDIGHPEDQKRTIKALGFHRLRETVVHEDGPALRGMVHKVRHLVHVEEDSSDAK